MIKEAIDRILELRRPETVDVEGIRYWAGNHLPIFEPRPESLKFATLGALRDYALNVSEEYGDSGKLFAVVDNPTSVSLYRKASDGARRRRLFAFAALPGYSDSTLAPEHWYDLEEFIIKIQAQFVPNDDREHVLQILGNITGEDIRTEQDDGVTQNVTVRAGVALKDSAKIENPVRLMPFRTFRELDQPESPFILRVKVDHVIGKVCALFEADGGTWRLAAIASAKDWLEDAIPDLTVLG